MSLGTEQNRISIPIIHEYYRQESREGRTNVICQRYLNPREPYQNKLDSLERSDECLQYH